jgi:peptidoglycan-N-acetylglucosamine deacetylase
VAVQQHDLNGAAMTDDHTRPPVGRVRAGYGSPTGPRYQPQSLVMSQSGDTAHSARAMPRSGSGKKEIFCAFGIDVDAVAGWLGSYGGEHSPCDISRGLFAGEVGVPRLVKLFDRLGVRTSWFIPGHSIETFPNQCKMVVDAGHEIGMHGYSHENPISMTPEQEERVMDKCIELIERLSGRRPTGYVAPWWEFSTVTNELLLKKGIKYDHSLMNNDFHPFYVRVGDSWTLINYSKHPDEWMKPLVRGEETDLIDIPGSWYLDDLPPMMFIKSAPNSHGFIKPRDIEELWCDQFDWVYREYDYAVFTMTIHPDVSGRPQVLLMLERVFDYISKHAGVKFCTFDEIADDFRRRYPRQGAAAQAARAG